MQRNFAEGLRAAIDETRPITTLPLTLVRLNHTGGPGLADNVKELVAHQCAFVVVGRPGAAPTERRIMATLEHYNVPIVTALTGSEALRHTQSHAGLFLRNGAAVRLPLVINVRASGGDEINAVLQVLSREWESLDSVAVVAHDSPFGRFSRNYTAAMLGVISAHASLRSYAYLAHEPSDRQVDEAGKALFPAGKEPPKSIILCTFVNSTRLLVRWLAHSGHTNVTLYLLSLTSASGINEMLDSDPQTRALLLRNGISFFFTQSMPFPTPAADRLATASSLLRRFNDNRAVRLKTHAALEGYLTGWFIYEVAQQSVNRHGLPLTRGDFLSTVFVDVRTFNVLDVVLGPYGDGGLSGVSRQTEQQACNQGVHEVFVTRFDPASGELSQLPGSSLRFPGCNTPRPSSSGAATQVGIAISRGSARDNAARAGLLGAIRHRSSLSGAASAIVLRTATGDAIQAAQLWKGTGLVGLVNQHLETSSAARNLSQCVLISPTPGYHELRRPFRRNIVNLFPSATDEAVAAFLFFQKTGVRNVTVIVNGNSSHAAECASAVNMYSNRSGTAEAFFVLGGTFDACRLGGVRAVLLLNSQVDVVPGSPDGPNSLNDNLAFRLSVSPPLSNFSATSELRTDFTEWVSSEDANGRSFESFFVGRFLCQVIDAALDRRKRGREPVTTEDVLDVVYSGSTFEIEGVVVGPFTDSSNDTLLNCNQGLDTVYVVQGLSARRVVHSFHVGRCGRDYVTTSTSLPMKERLIYLWVGLALALVLAICAVALLAMWRSRRGATFINIRKAEIELGMCFGKGLFGSIYMADWHGTPVVVVVVDKKAATNDGLRQLKSEALMLQHHHHPNLVMLVGYCETRSELLIVTEFTEGGILDDFVLTQKRFTDAYALAAMAFVSS
eukprot:m51a1_g8857 putative tkl protein kinase (897) ;mRNA; f:518323-521565